MAAWDPQAEPYRTMWIRHAPHVTGGWLSTVESFATLDEAIEAAKRPFVAGVYLVYVDRADFATSWQKDGRWTRMAKRERKQALALADTIARRKEAK